MVVGEALVRLDRGGPSAPPLAARPELTVVLTQSRWQRAMKRVMDVALAGFPLLVMFPVLAIVGICVRLSSKGPALFRQTHVGRGGEAIQITKFRTMVPEAASILSGDPELRRRYIEGGFKLRQEEDPRITRVGRFLRQLSLDELPQLWDVVAGRMSLVGPRPVMLEELEYYGPYVDAYLAVKPGITGLWQVHGRSDVGFPERCRIDFFYVSRWSVLLDLKVLLRTLPAVIRRRGAY